MAGLGKLSCVTAAAPVPVVFVVTLHWTNPFAKRGHALLHVRYLGYIIKKILHTKPLLPLANTLICESNSALFLCQAP